jgi:2-polyprenyl-3-methyl-5-hydroxy-6-metoxy-1,4-benzoquinol methylase
MFNSNTDREWEIFGRDDPYFGVITHEIFRISNLTDANKEKFFLGGYEYVDHIFNKIRKQIDPNHTVKKALDFGCGVGRIVIPLAKLAEKVIGIDISDSMLN